MLSTKFVEDFEVEVSVRLKINFRQYFAADVWLNLGQDSEARFGQDFEVQVQLRF